MVWKQASRRHPGADIDDQSGFLGDRNEFAGSDQSVLGIAPADQRLGAFHAVAEHVHLGLIEQDEFLIGQRGAHTLFEVEAVTRLGVHFAREEAVLGAAVRLRELHGAQAVLEQVVEVLAVGGIDADADGEGDEHLLALDDDRLLDRVQHLFGDDDAVVDGADRRHDREFVAVEPRRRVARADHLRQAFRDFLEQLIARRITQRIVDQREAVEAHDQEGDRFTRAPRVEDVLADAVGEQRAVGQAGEGVVADAPGLAAGGVGLERVRKNHGEELAGVAAAASWIGVIDRPCTWARPSACLERTVG